jgi:hypothetical protein
MRWENSAFSSYKQFERTTDYREVQPTGNNGGIIVWEWHLWDHLIQDFDGSTNPILELISSIQN